MEFRIDKSTCQVLERGISSLQRGIKTVEELNSTMNSSTLSRSLEILSSSEKDLKTFYAKVI